MSKPTRSAKSRSTNKTELISTARASPPSAEATSRRSQPVPRETCSLRRLIAYALSMGWVSKTPNGRQSPIRSGGPSTRGQDPALTVLQFAALTTNCTGASNRTLIFSRSPSKLRSTSALRGWTTPLTSLPDSTPLTQTPKVPVDARFPTDNDVRDAGACLADGLSVATKALFLSSYTARDT